MIASTRRGYSLIETLVVITIIAVLASILMPTLTSAKRQAVKTDDMSKMRQLGQAAAMYEDRHGEFALHTSQLLAERLVTPELLVSTRDDTEDGLANQVARYTTRLLGDLTHLGRPVQYKNTFIALGDFGLDHQALREDIMSGPAAGWLIDVIESERNEFPTPTQWNGTYRRLTLEGSVVTRRHEDFQCYNGGVQMPCRMSTLLYVDPSPRFVEMQRSSDEQYSTGSSR
jgi:prepilin-type N-terminal cleavage/methylation domain-containing protein